MEKFMSRRDKQKLKAQASKDEVPSSPKQPWHATRRVRLGAAIAGGLALIVIMILISLQIAASNTIKEMKAAKSKTTENIQSLQTAYTKTPLKERSGKLQDTAHDLHTVDCSNLARLPWFADAQTQCMAFAQKSEVLQQEITQLAEIVAYDAYIKTMLSPVQEPKDKITNYQAETDSWKKVQDAFAKAPQKDTVGKAHTQLTEAVKAVAENWQRIATANKDKKAKDFNQARETLGDTFAVLKAAGEKLTEEYTKAQQSTAKAYNAYTKQKL